MTLHAFQPRDDLAVPDVEKGAIKVQPSLPLIGRALGPLQPGSGKGRFIRRIRDLLSQVCILKLRKFRELGPASLANQFPQVLRKIAEEQKRRRRRKFLSHEKHRYLRREKID